MRTMQKAERCILDHVALFVQHHGCVHDAHLMIQIIFLPRSKDIGFDSHFGVNRLFGRQIEHVIVTKMIGAGNDAWFETECSNVLDGRRFEFGLTRLKVCPEQVGGAGAVETFVKAWLKGEVVLPRVARKSTSYS